MNLNPNFVLRYIHHLYLLVPIKKNSITKEAILLNKTSVMIFKQCTSASTPEALAEIIASNFNDIAISEAKAKLTPYIIDLLEQGFLTAE